MARFRAPDRLALFRPALFRPVLFRPVLFLPALFRLALFRPALFRLALLRPLREDFRAELPPLRLADRRPLLADFRALFLAPLRADFLPLRLAELRLDFFREPPPLPLREVVPLPRPVDAGSSKSKDGDELGVGDGVLSEGSGSIHPEPDQPISIK